MSRSRKYDIEDGQSIGADVLTRMVMRLFEHWSLTYKQQAAMLSLSTSTHTSIANFKSGRSSISLNRDTLDRIKHLLAIHKYLRLIFPENRNLVYKWPSSPNKHFQGKTPVEIIINEGFLGVVRVRRYLESYIGA